MAVICVTESESLNPSQIGLILSFILGIQMAFTFAVRQLAEVENDMNSVERLLHYGNNLEQEAAFQKPEATPPPTWPEKGQISFNNVKFRYREGLPLVLHGLSMEVAGGEKIGVIGRTGAGKSSLMQAIFRIVELDAGSISIDGRDLSRMGLFDLRSRIAIIPQDALLFAGSKLPSFRTISYLSAAFDHLALRTNLDPFGRHDDARLWDALRRSYLVDRQKGKGASDTGRFQLDMQIDEEGMSHCAHHHTGSGDSSNTKVAILSGLNLSQGERSLVSLARALVKDSRVVILDEAVRFILCFQFEFPLRYDACRLLVSIWQQTRSFNGLSGPSLERRHCSQSRIVSRPVSFSDFVRLVIFLTAMRAVISYDRVLVMDKGMIAEFDTPINLFSQADGIFRSMCEQSNISREDIEKAKTESLSDEIVEPARQIIAEQAQITEQNHTEKPPI